MDPEQLLALLNSTRSQNMVSPLDTMATAGMDNRVLEAFIAQPFVQDTLISIMVNGLGSTTPTFSTEAAPEFNTSATAAEFGPNSMQVRRSNPTNVELNPAQLNETDPDSFELMMRLALPHELGHSFNGEHFRNTLNMFDGIFGAPQSMKNTEATANLFGAALDGFINDRSNEQAGALQFMLDPRFNFDEKMAASDKIAGPATSASTFMDLLRKRAASALLTDLSSNPQGN